MSNQRTYERDYVVQLYSRTKELQKPEQVVLDTFGQALAGMKMLDMGVGAGRTTAYFAPRVKEYVAIDYSRKMVAACRERFPDHAGSFRVCDARSMSGFADDYFDFVLFSFNGVDYVSASDRARIFGEIRRVSRHGAYFLFSTHNLDTDIEGAFSLRFAFDAGGVLKQTARLLLFRILNPDWRNQRKTASYMIINDGAHRFSTRTFYIRPHEQLRQLDALGFNDVKVLTLNGQEVQGDAFDHSADPWLYFLCRLRKH